MQNAAQSNLYLDSVALRVEMARRGFRSMAALARAVDLSGGYCRQMAAGLIPPQNTREKIAAALGVDMDRLWRPAGQVAA